MKAILKSILALAVAIVSVSCGPSKYMMHLEMRYPSKAGIDLAGKNVSVVYLENGSEFQDGFNSAMAEAMASTIEADYGTGESSVGIFKMQRHESADYSAKDSLTNLLIETGSDVLFLIDTVKFGEMSIGGQTKVSSKADKDSSFTNIASIPYTIRMYCYDAMNQKDEVKTFGGTSISQTTVYSNGMLGNDELQLKAYHLLPAAGNAAGQLVGSSFISQWKVEAFSVLYFESAKWISALEKADQLDWKGAMDIWFGLLQTNDLMKRSCAAYNIALSCYMLGDYKLSQDWLDISDRDSELPMSSVLRKRIKTKL